MRLRAWIWIVCTGLAACGGQSQPPAPTSAEQALPRTSAALASESEAHASEASTSEASASETSTSETSTSETSTSETSTSETSTSETSTSETSTSEAPAAAADQDARQAPAPEAAAQPTVEATAALQAEMADLLLQAEAILDAGHEAPRHRLLQSVLEARRRNPDDAAVATLAERVASRLMDWDELALAHDNAAWLQRDLALLQRWDRAHPRVQALAAEHERLQRLDAQVKKAERQRAAGKRLSPPGDNAVESLHEVLKQAPEHRASARYLAEIEAELLDEVLQAADANRFAEAEALLAQAGRVRDFSPQVQDMAARVVALREQRQEAVRMRVKGALDAGDAGAAKTLLPELEAVALGSDEADRWRAQIERVQRYGVHDAGALLLDPLADGGQGPGLVVLPVGSFMMGSAADDSGRHASELPSHRVHFTRGFAMSRTEITVGQFRAFIESSGHRSQTRGNRKAPVYDERRGSIIERQGVTWRDDYAGKPAPDELPVVHVSWEDAVAYAQWLSDQTGARYRLPSEAEFEYALRAGSSGVFPWPGRAPPRGSENLTGALDASPSGRNWSNAFEGYGDGYWGPAPVGRFASNAFGLADINGNVSEWVADCWHDSYARAPRDGSAWVNPGCQQRVVRGGSWASSPERSRAAFRLPSAPTSTSPRVGFRVVREL